MQLNTETKMPKINYIYILKNHKNQQYETHNGPSECFKSIVSFSSLSCFCLAYSLCLSNSLKSHAPSLDA